MASHIPLMVAALVTLLSVAGLHVLAEDHKPSIIFVLTDDQDVPTVDIGLPFFTQHIKSVGKTFSHYFTTTPVCCPSRSAILSARYAHNTINVGNQTSPGCLRQHKTAFPVFLQNAGLRTGMFGKFLNVGGMERFCPNLDGHETPEGWDHFFGMCPDTCYENCAFADNGKLVRPTDHHGYATAVIGNRSLHFVQEALDDNKPFFAYVAVHAPHLPCTPAPWYKNRFSNFTAPRSAAWNASGSDKHWLVSVQPPLTDQVAEELDGVYRNRLRTLLSVDDIFQALHTAVDKAGRLNDTYFFFTSDHGFHLGEFRLGAAKRQVYETDIRVPLVVSGPGIQTGSSDALINHIDLGPTFLEIAGAAPPTYFDGRSFLSILNGDADSSDRTVHLVEYIGGSLGRDVVGHYQRSPNNTYIAIRTKTDSGEWSYSEFTNNGFDFSDPYFYELYNLSQDPLQLHNVFYDPSTTKEVKEQMHDTLHKYFKCQGNTGPNGCFNPDDANLRITPSLQKAEK